MLKEIERSLCRETFSALSGNCRIDDKHSLLITPATWEEYHSFRVSISFAGEDVSWTFVFDPHNPDFPPDIFMDGEDENFEIDLSQIKCLNEWSSEKAAVLIPLVVRAVLKQYAQYQQNKCQKWERIKFELDALLNCGEFPRENIEVHVKTDKDGTFLKASFLIQLNCDFPPLPTALKLENPGVNYAVLLVTFPSSNCAGAQSRLFLSRGLQCALQRSGAFVLPSFKVENCLIDYVPVVSERLVKQLGSINKGLQERREYINQLLTRFGRSVLEYDSDNFEKLVLLQDYNDFFFILEVRLNDAFPDSSPEILFRSVYHTTTSSGGPYLMHVINVPFSPRWSGEEHYTRLIAFVIANIPNFQRKSCLEGTKI